MRRSPRLPQQKRRQTEQPRSAWKPISQEEVELPERRRAAEKKKERRKSVLGKNDQSP